MTEVLFDDDDENLGSRNRLSNPQLSKGADYNELNPNGPLNDPLSDSFKDKNKLSKSEKSLKKPLQLFQEEMKNQQAT